MSPSAAHARAYSASPTVSRVSSVTTAAVATEIAVKQRVAIEIPTTRCYVSTAKEKVNGVTLNYGQVVEIIPDQLYFASFSRGPNVDTPFPYVSKAVVQQPFGRLSRNYSMPPALIPEGPRNHPPTYISMEENLAYNPFFQDFGPLSMGQLHRLSFLLHEAVVNPANQDRAIVIWTNMESRNRANAACAIACYLTLWQDWSPHSALSPFAQMDPTCMPFRDAGYSQADYVLNVQDVVYGVWKAKREGLCDITTFLLEEYELFEHVEQGDFNWITPQFLAFASPQHLGDTVIAPGTPQYDALPKTLEGVLRSRSLPNAFRNVLAHFTARNVGLVVRLNSHLYPASYFTALGIQHLDMIFDDGTCPSLDTVRNFIDIAHRMITVRNQGVAVHCKAGLGRTGCLIGAYLIYRHGFTANEIIAFMRVMRPGMVVGPQQHWLHINQGAFREWWLEDRFKEQLARLAVAQQQQATAPPSTPPPTRPALATTTSNSTSGSCKVRVSNDNNGHGHSPLRSSTNSSSSITLSQPMTPTPGGAYQQNHHHHHHHHSSHRQSPSHQRRSALSEIQINDQQAAMPTPAAVTATSVIDADLPMPTPGQPRKTNRSNTQSHGTPAAAVSQTVPGASTAKTAAAGHGLENMAPTDYAPSPSPIMRISSMYRQQQQQQQQQRSTTPEDEPDAAMMAMSSPLQPQQRREQGTLANADELDSEDDLQLRRLRRRRPGLEALLTRERSQVQLHRRAASTTTPTAATGTISRRTRTMTTAAAAVAAASASMASTTVPVSARASRTTTMTTSTTTTTTSTGSSKTSMYNTTQDTNMVGADAYNDGGGSDYILSSSTTMTAATKSRSGGIATNGGSSPAVRTSARPGSRSGPGSVAAAVGISHMKTRASPARRGAAAASDGRTPAGVRKTSGRVGSIGSGMAGLAASPSATATGTAASSVAAAVAAAGLLR